MLYDFVFKDTVKQPLNQLGNQRGGKKPLEFTYKVTARARVVNGELYDVWLLKVKNQQRETGMKVDQLYRLEARALQEAYKHIASLNSA